MSLIQTPAGLLSPNSVDSFLDGLTTKPPNPQIFPLLQERQATLLEACGFPCAPAGNYEFDGKTVPMWRATGEKRKAVASLIGYGGAAFGGKSYGMLILARVAAELWPGVQIAYFRKTYTELDGPGSAMQKAYEVFAGSQAKDSDGGKEWNWPNGSSFFFRHCQNEKDRYNYQSQQIDILLSDESTHFTWTVVDYLITRNRAGGGIKTAGFTPFAVMASNPGNVGHAWYTQLFDLDKSLEDADGHEQVKRRLNPNGKYSMVYFIPAFLKDNQIGVAQDPEYEERLLERDPEVSRALLKGDWTVFAGQMFPGWTRDRIACDPFDIPDWWPKWRAYDYGLAHPAAMGWFTLDPDMGRVYCYRATTKIGLSDTQHARLIKQMSPPEEEVHFTYAGHDVYTKRPREDNRISTIEDEFRKEGILLTKADNDHRNGVRKIHRLLVDLPDGFPAIQVFEPYYSVFACMTTLVRDEKDPEDVVKVDGDDAFDMLKYGLTNLKPSTKRKEDKERRSQNPLAGSRSL